MNNTLSAEAACGMAALLALADLERGDVETAKKMLEALTGTLGIDYLRQRVRERLGSKEASRV